MGLWNKNTDEPSETDRIFAASVSGNPDVSSSLTARNPNIGERALVSGHYGAGVNVDQLAKVAKKFI